jgi:hypothetical protein
MIGIFLCRYFLRKVCLFDEVVFTAAVLPVPRQNCGNRRLALGIMLLSASSKSALKTRISLM